MEFHAHNSFVILQTCGFDEHGSFDFERHVGSIVRVIH